MRTAIALALLILCAAALFLTGCRKCARGHYITVHVPEQTTELFVLVGKIMIPIPETTPAHDEQQFVCDEEGK